MKALMTVVLLMTLTGMLALAQDTTPGVGDPAPDFSLAGSDGRSHSLAEYRGKPVVIAWFPKAFTTG